MASEPLSLPPGPADAPRGSVPAVLLISIAGAAALVALAAAWLWITRGSQFLIDIAQAFCL